MERDGDVPTAASTKKGEVKQKKEREKKWEVAVAISSLHVSRTENKQHATKNRRGLIS